MSWSGWLKLLLLTAVALVIVAFTMQNMSRTTQLSLDLYVAAWKLARPIAVPVLVWAAFGSGLVLAGVWGWVRGLALARKVRKLEQELALGSTRGRNDDWVRSA